MPLAAIQSIVHSIRVTFANIAAQQKTAYTRFQSMPSRKAEADREGL
jgi:hypothetical protein